MPPDKTTTDDNAAADDKAAPADDKSTKLYGDDKDAPKDDKAASDDKAKDDDTSADDDKKSDDAKADDKADDKTDDGDKKSDDKSDDKDDKSDDKDDDKKSEIEIKVPEGIEADEEVLKEVRSLAEEAGLKSEQIQPLVDLHFKQLEALTQAGQKAWDDTIKGWKAEIEKDTDIGGDNSKAVQSVLGTALDQFGTPEARDAFDVTGAGWNPHIIKFVYNMAKALNEGTHVDPGKPSPTKPKSQADALYGSSN